MIQLKFSQLIFVLGISILLISCKKNETPPPAEFAFPSKVINKILVEPSGVKWFATEKGIFSFDGKKWTTYKDDKNLTNGMVSDFLFERMSGLNKLWLGTNVGATSFEFGASAISVSNFSKRNSVLLSDTVSALGIDDYSTKYIGTSKGLSILKNNKWDKFYGRNGEEILSRYRISSVATTQNGYIYAATEGGGVSRFKYTDAVSGATTFKKPWAWGLPSDTVYTMLTDALAQWYGTNRGVGYHSTEFTKSDWITYTRADGLVCDTVYAIAKDLSGSIWFGTAKGISKFDGQKWNNYTTKDGLVSNKVKAIAVDIDRSIWFGTDKGISHFTNSQWINY